MIFITVLIQKFLDKIFQQEIPIFGTTYEATFVGLLPVTSYTVYVYPVNDEGEVGDSAGTEATTGIGNTFSASLVSKITTFRC